MIALYLDENMWRERFGKSYKLSLLNMICHITKLYLLAWSTSYSLHNQLALFRATHIV